jgi:hypothetical protein
LEHFPNIRPNVADVDTTAVVLRQALGTTIDRPFTADRASMKTDAASGDTARRVVGGSLRNAIASIRTAVGPNAQLSPLGSMRPPTRDAAPNADPMVERMLRVQERIADILQRAAGRADRRRAGRSYDPSGDDEPSRGGSAPGDFEGDY